MHTEKIRKKKNNNEEFTTKEALIFEIKIKNLCQKMMQNMPIS